MLLIEEGDNVALPKEHHEVHNICAHIYDHLTEILVNDTYEELRRTEFPINDKQEQVKEMRSEELHAIDWLVLNGMHSELTTVLVKHITCSILSDFISFVYESLNAAKKGKLSVAYSLLRKPFVDELLLLEQILIDKDDFINRYYLNGDIDLYDPSNAKIDKRAIIEKALNKVSYNSIFTKEFIYELRYDKSAAYGINSISNQAIHIVTRDKNYRTLNKELNFVFSTQEDNESYWHHYYKIVPYLLFYSAAVLDAIVFDFLPDETLAKNLKAFKRLMTFIVFTEASKINERIDTNTVIEIFSGVLEHTCKVCSNEIKFELADFKLFIECDILLCDRCFTDQFVDKNFAEKFMNLDF
jgi:hypothetical protein